MTLLTLIAASYTFFATATGVEKGTPIEFLFAGNGSDRDYETMFLLDGDVSTFTKAIEKAGLKRGSATDRASCKLWPVGCRITMNPKFEEFIECKMPNNQPVPNFIYTGGTLIGKKLVADEEMPLSMFSLYSIAQSPIVPNGVYEQGEVYGAFTAAKKFEKGKRVKFTISWNDASMPIPLKFIVKPGNGAELINTIKNTAKKGEVDAMIDFDGSLTVDEAAKVANALAVLDSVMVKINGCSKSKLFYRAFLPLTKWLDRKERLAQPFELTIDDTNKLVFIDEDWSVEGDDPKLTPKEIDFKDAKNHPKTDTCFVYCKPNTKLSQVYSAIEKVCSESIFNWYVFQQNNQSSHNLP